MNCIYSLYYQTEGWNWSIEDLYICICRDAAEKFETKDITATGPILILSARPLNTDKPGQKIEINFFLEISTIYVLPQNSTIDLSIVLRQIEFDADKKLLK